MYVNSCCDIYVSSHVYTLAAVVFSPKIEDVTTMASKSTWYFKKCRKADDDMLMGYYCACFIGVKLVERWLQQGFASSIDWN